MLKESEPIGNHATLNYSRVTPVQVSFRERLRALDRRFRALAERDRDVYLPNFAPVGPVDYALIAMEPSLGRWAVSPPDARTRIMAGYRNFMWSLEDFVLHMAAREYLCHPGETYHLTDLSKGAMTVERADGDRAARYARWFPLLIEEINLVAKPLAPIVAIGKVVEVNLHRLGFTRPFTTVLHYSGQAGKARRAAVAGREQALRAFASAARLDDLVAAAAATLRENRVPAALVGATLARLRRTRLTDSRVRLLFAYKLAFQRIRRSLRSE